LNRPLTIAAAQPQIIQPSFNERRSGSSHRNLKGEPMRRTLIASAFALVGLSAVAPAQAMPFAPAHEASAGVTLVAYGCGPGFSRGPYGGCHPMGALPPRAAYGYHPYAHPYAYGRHCWWRGGVRVCN
jgi:hypothetical protein